MCVLKESNFVRIYKDKNILFDGHLVRGIRCDTTSSIRLKFQNKDDTQKKSEIFYQL